MSGKAKVVLTDYVWESLDVEKKTLAGLAEPGIDPMLLGLPNVVVTAHMGSAVDSLREAMAAVAVDNILAVLAGRPAPNCWNPEVYSRTA